jgi:hypothetical protein
MSLSAGREIYHSRTKLSETSRSLVPISSASSRKSKTHKKTAYPGGLFSLYIILRTLSSAAEEGNGRIAPCACARMKNI